jgi:hypothetical protein
MIIQPRLQPVFARFGLGFFMMLSGACGVAAESATAPETVPANMADRSEHVSVRDIGPVWSGHPVGFALLTSGDWQFAAYYDAKRQLTLARRSLGETRWEFKKLPTEVGWDSHNYVTISLDRAGCLHVSGNMHAQPLVYFRGGKPFDIAGVDHVSEMTGVAEDHMTYPRFLHLGDGELVFSYRDGGSGRGSVIYNVYDEAAKSWRRLLDQPLLDGQGRMSAYPDGPLLGQDGYYHMAWVWRDSPAAETTHDLCYARSKDLVHWETAAGHEIGLPIQAGTEGVSVDPVPVRGGLINGSGKIGFDTQGRVILAYHKFDGEGNTQLYLARFEGGEWRIVQASDWKYRWEFSGTGSLNFDIRHGGVEVVAGGMAVCVKHVKYGTQLYGIDPDTLKLTNPVAAPEVALPPELANAQSAFPGMAVRWADDSGKREDGIRYRLRWESLVSNRDKPRPEPWPAPVMLQLIEIRQSP